MRRDFVGHVVRNGEILVLHDVIASYEMFLGFSFYFENVCVETTAVIRKQTRQQERAKPDSRTKELEENCGKVGGFAL